MLVLSRKLNEQIVIQIGEQKVVVCVVAMTRDRVRLGVAAPPEVSVHREEVACRIAEWHDHPNATPVVALPLS
jgi:carbon storage regulator